MEEILKSIQSVYWWFSVIIVGVGVNLFTLFLKPKLDNFLSKWSAKRRNKNSAKKLAWEKEIDKIKSDINYNNYLQSKMILHLAFFIGYLCFSILFTILAVSIPDSETLGKRIIVGFTI